MSLVGYSEKINDPAFEKYLSSSKRYSWIFSWFLAVAFSGGFFIYGATSRDMDNPQALFIGVGLGAMMLVISFFTNLSRSRSRTWDGVVLAHKIEKKQKKVYRTGNDYYMQAYKLYIVVIQDDRGKSHKLTSDDDAKLYDYYKDGDQVRHHARLNTYEKYDKSKDVNIFCNACSTLNEISVDLCHRCKCPLLK